MVRVHIKTYGCAHNMADSETMAHYLQQAGYDVTGFGNAHHILAKESKLHEEQLLMEADIIIFNTCTVKNPSDDKFFSLLHKQNKPVIIAGCIPQSQRKEEWLASYSAIGVEQLDEIVFVVDRTLAGEVIHNLARRPKGQARTFLPVIRKNPFIAIIPILQGCLGSCTFCKTKSARGHLKSYSLDSIIEQVRIAKHDGVKEIWLVSEDNGAYGLDINLTLIDLLDAIREVNGTFKVRIGMLNPEYAYRYKEELVSFLNHPLFYSFLHIPVQSGDDAVLQAMRRPYTIAQYTETILYLRLHCPTISLATDIICGFPGETDEQFKRTMDLLKEFQFDAVNISKFYPRPGTLAAKMKHVPTIEVKKRSKELSDWFNQQNTNRSYLGKQVTAIFTERGKEEHSFIGKTDNYKQVIVYSDALVLGTKQTILVSEVTRDDLRGNII